MVRMTHLIAVLAIALGQPAFAEPLSSPSPTTLTLADLEQSVPTIPTVFATNPKEHVVNATYGSSQKVWQHKADFDSKVPPVIKAIANVKGKVKDVASLKRAYESINDKCADCHETYRLKLK